MRAEIERLRKMAMAADAANVRTRQHTNNNNNNNGGGGNGVGDRCSETDVNLLAASVAQTKSLKASLAAATADGAKKATRIGDLEKSLSAARRTAQRDAAAATKALYDNASTQETHKDCPARLSKAKKAAAVCRGDAERLRREVSALQTRLSMTKAAAEAAVVAAASSPSKSKKSAKPTTKGSVKAKTRTSKQTTAAAASTATKKNGTGDAAANGDGADEAANAGGNGNANGDVNVDVDVDAMKAKLRCKSAEARSHSERLRALQGAHGTSYDIVSCT
jgi:hypothetical protein